MDNRRILNASLVVWFVVACSTAEPPASQSLPAVATAPPGAWTLVQIDGHRLPYRPVDPDRPPQAGPGPQIVRGSINLEPDGKFEWKVAFRRDAQSPQNEMTQAGTWTLNNGALLFVWPNGATTPGTFDGATLTFNNLGMVFSFKRQTR